jgi:thioesterase domain-containing protein
MLRTNDTEVPGDPRAHLPDRGWGEVLGREVPTVYVAGDHSSMVQEPHAGGVAAAIDRAFAAVGI